MRFLEFVAALCMFVCASASAQETAQAAKSVRASAKHAKANDKQRLAALPARKDGLWEVLIRADGLVLKRAGRGTPQPVTVRQCTSAEAEPVMLMAIVPGQEDCHERKVRQRDQGGYDISTVCYVHDNRVDTQMQLLGDLNSAYRGSFEAKFPQTPLNNSGRTVFEGRWLGACAAGQRPGGGGRQPVQVLAGGVAERLPEQGLLVGEVIEHQPGRDPEGGGHVAHPGAGEPAGDHLTAGRPEDLLAADVRLDARHGRKCIGRLVAGQPRRLY